MEDRRAHRFQLPGAKTTGTEGSVSTSVIGGLRLIAGAAGLRMYLLHNPLANLNFGTVN